MKGIVCKVCGYISINGSAPENCPVCHAPKTSFEAKEDAIKTAGSQPAGGETEKKHIPKIAIVKTCGLIPGGGCTDVHVKVGEVQHPMEEKHYIMHIDFYVDNEFVGRIIMTPGKCNPAGALHLKASSGKLTAIELCNVHGAWISETNI